jgi:disulfide bond formation protein DsbB
MKIEGGIFVYGAIFYFIVTGIYAVVAAEPIGTTVLALTGGLSAIIGTYIHVTGKRIGARPEDRLDGEISEADANYGFYSPHSWWPLMVGASFSLVFLGLVFAVWLMVLAMVFLVIAVAGWLFEYQTGDFSE